MTATVILIGADKGGVGKTMVSRTVADYLIGKGRKARVFDTESPKGILKRFVADADVIDITKVPDQMRVFDGVSDEVLTLVDIRAGLLSPTLKALDDAMLLEDVRAGNMNLILVHVLGDTVDSIAEVTRAAEMLGSGAKHFLVKNHIKSDQQFDWERDEFKATLEGLKDVTIEIEALPSIATEHMDKRGGSFGEFIGDASSKTLCGIIRRWLKNVWQEFERVNLIP